MHFLWLWEQSLPTNRQTFCNCLLWIWGCGSEVWPSCDTCLPQLPTPRLWPSCFPTLLWAVCGRLCSLIYIKGVGSKALQVSESHHCQHLNIIYKWIITHYQRQKKLDCPFLQVDGSPGICKALPKRWLPQNHTGRNVQLLLKMLPSPHSFVLWLINLCHGKTFNDQKKFFKFFLAPILCYNSTDRQPRELAILRVYAWSQGSGLLDFQFHHGMATHSWLWPGYFCFLGGHLSISEERSYSGNKLIHRTGTLSPSQLFQRHRVWVTPLGCYWGWVSEDKKESLPSQCTGVFLKGHVLALVTDESFFFPFLLARTLDFLLCRACQYLLNGRCPHERGGVYCSPSRVNGKGAVEASGISCSIRIGFRIEIVGVSFVTVPT